MIISDSEDAAGFRGQEFISELYQNNYRFIAVHSSKLAGRKQRGFNPELDKKEKELEKVFKWEAEKSIAP